MNKNDFLSYIETYVQELKDTLDSLDRDAISDVVEILTGAYKKGKKVFIIGNGGSASNASHMACDFGKGTLSRRYDDHRKRFRVYSLTDNVATITAYGNDLSYDDIFVQQLRNLISAGDVLICLSASGNSTNVIKAVRYAKRRKAVTIGILGFETGGTLATLVDSAVIAKSKRYGPCEDIQLVLDHIITGWIAKLRETSTQNI